MKSVTITTECEEYCKQLGQDHALTLEIRATERALKDKEHTVSATHVDQARMEAAVDLLNAIDNYAVAVSTAASEIATGQASKERLAQAREEREKALKAMKWAFHWATGYKVIGGDVPGMGVWGCEVEWDGIVHGEKACNLVDVMRKAE